ncbi:MAG: restriction endonuclease [Candidatus Pacebacteria bacterium]|nr:restriction endonuclease [Candidatus Paceibacterota bacterium]
MEINPKNFFWEILKNMLMFVWENKFLLVLIVIIFITGIIIRIFSLRKNYFKKGAKWRSDRDYIYWLRGISPKEFEEYIAELFKQLGYKAFVTGGPNDGGVDVIAEKNGIKHYIQCKRFITKTVSVAAVREFYGALGHYLAKGKGYFITTNKFTLEAEKFAEDKPIELIDGQKLIQYIRLAKKEKDLSDSPLLEKCPNCDGKLVEKKGKFGKFYGCSNYPRCLFTKQLKKETDYKKD